MKRIFVYGTLRTDMYNYEKYLKEQEAKSLFKREGIDLNSNDRILTLITCGYDFVNARIVIVAKEVN